MTELELKNLIARGELITLEFKSDRNCLADRDLLQETVAMANTDGGHILLGVEDDGMVTGLHANHQDLTSLPALLMNRTRPSVSVTVERVETTLGNVAVILVEQSRAIIATTDGSCFKRRLKFDGKPETVPFLPHEFPQRLGHLGVSDHTATILMDLTEKDLSPLERERIRETIRNTSGDKALLNLSDDELDGALQLTVNVDGVKHPTLAGLLLVGREEALRRLLPTHEVAFQELRGTDVRLNEFTRKPLVHAFEQMDLYFRARVIEEEFQWRMLRIAVPNYDRQGFREALVNALIHRDYARSGAVHIQLTDAGLSISNPGGFVEGVSVENLLTTPPKARNPLLADIVKRIGLAERTGRGIDRIYEGVLRYGRPLPDYTRSNIATVELRIQNVAADHDFLRMVIEYEDSHGALPLETLIVLGALRAHRRSSCLELAKSLGHTENTVRGILEQLSEAGLVDAHGNTRGRFYTLSAKLYQRAGQKSEYVRQLGFTPLQNEQMILSYIAAHGCIRKSEIMDLCHLTRNQSATLIGKMKKKGSVVQQGELKIAVYVAGTSTINSL